MPIQYPVLGFKPTPSWTLVFFHNHWTGDHCWFYVQKESNILCTKIISIIIIIDVSVTRLGYFWKLLVTYFHTKVDQIFGKLFGNLKKTLLLNQKSHLLFFGNFCWKIGLLFISASGHTDHHHRSHRRSEEILFAEIMTWLDRRYRRRRCRLLWVWFDR